MTESSQPIHYNLSALSLATDVPMRTIRFYITKGLVDRPQGARKTATYTQTHAEQLITIKQLSATGMTLDGIAKVLSGDNNAPEQQVLQPGQTRVVQQIHICQGVDITIDPLQAALTHEQIRHIASLVHDTVKEYQPDES
jgi:DNA-binding transcriptional MerR regulator